MPDDVATALITAHLRRAYDHRPAYQRNDYLRWIDGATRPETRAKRIGQMLRELEQGGVYMGMPHPPSRR